MTEREGPNTDVPENDGTDYFDITQVEDVAPDDTKLMKEAEAAASSAVLNMEHKLNERELNRAEAYIESNLVRRARELVRLDAIKFVHFKKSRPNDQESIGVTARTDSLMNRHAVYDALFDGGSGEVPFPHYDTFRGRLVDHEGQPFSARTLRTRDLVMALDAAGMENPSDKEVQDSLRSWALDHKRDSLHDYFEASMPEWDGKSRMDTLLLDLFKPNDTPLNRLFSRYFWMSLYNRITNPGSQAPIVLSLIGAQDLGKSYFSVLLCRLLTGDENIGPVKLDLGAKNYNGFLRSITGKSLVAVVGEMTGFKKGDMDRIKDFVTKTEDDLDFKFEDSIIKERQWITIMDGNSYDGLQRDDTGNRRFYPMFCFQAPDDKGQPSWFKGKSVDFKNFKEDLWQTMAECRAWMAEHGGRGYDKLIKQTNTEVAAFSTSEMDHGRGITKDEAIETNLKRVLLACDYATTKHNAKHQGWFVATSAITDIFTQLRLGNIWLKSLKPRMAAMGFVAGSRGGPGFVIPYEAIGENEVDKSLEALLRHIFAHDEPDHGMSVAEVDAEISIQRKAIQGGGGF